MQQQSQEKIRFLQKKVKSLQKEMAERVRNFLLHANKKAIMHYRNVSCQTQSESSISGQIIGKDVSIQTQQAEENVYNRENLLKESGISLFQANSQNLIEQNLRQDTSPIKMNQISNLSTENNELTIQVKKPQTGAKLLKLIQNEQESQQLESSTFEQETVETKDQILSEFYKKQRKKLRRQISKLKEKLEFLQAVSYQAKEGLLQSEEENYSFRIKISQMSKEVKKLNHEKHQLNYKIQLLQAQNQALKHSLDQAMQSASKENTHQSNISQLRDQQLDAKYDQLSNFLELLKNKLHRIASLLPAKLQNHQMSMFRPQNQDQILQIMHQIEAYFTQAQKTYEQIIQQANKSKNIFVATIELVNQLIEHKVRLEIVQKLSKFTELKQYLSVFKRSQRKNVDK